MQSLLSPHILKMKSKGIDSVKARVCNLNSLEPSLTHIDLAKAITESFYEKHKNEFDICRKSGEFQDFEFSHQKDDYHNLLQKELFFDKKRSQTPKNMIQNDRLDYEGCPLTENEKELLNIRNINSEVFEGDLIKNIWEKMARQDWILGEAPSFSNNIEFKNEAGFFDIYYEANKGVFTSFMVFSDCLFSNFVEAIETAFSPSNFMICGREGIEKGRQTVLTQFEGDLNVKPLINTFFDDLALSLIHI